MLRSPDRSSSRIYAALVYLLVFIGGFSVMSIELLGGRILAPYFGSSIHVWGSIIAEHLMTREFLEETKAILVSDGVLVANTFSSSRLYDSESVTYRAAFGPFLNLKRMSGNRIIIARAGRAPTLAELEAGAARWKATLARYGVDADSVVDVASDRPDWRANARPLTDQYNPANLLQRF